MALATNALTTLQTVKDELGISDASKDSVLERQINAVSDRIQSVCQRKFYYQSDIEEKLAGYGTTRITLSRTPVISVSSVKVDNATLETNEYEVEKETGILFRETGWSWSAARRGGMVQDQLPGSEEKNITVTYTGGYVTPKQAGDDGSLTRNLPNDLEEACIIGVVSFYLRRGEDVSIKSESLMSASYDYDRTTGLPTIVMDMINPYKRVVMA